MLTIDDYKFKIAYLENALKISEKENETLKKCLFQMQEAAKLSTQKVEETNIKQRCDVLVIALVGKDMSQKWWDSPNKAFGYKEPIHTDINEVYDYLMFHSYGN